MELKKSGDELIMSVLEFIFQTLSRFSTCPPAVLRRYAVNTCILPAISAAGSNGIQVSPLLPATR